MRVRNLFLIILFNPIFIIPIFGQTQETQYKFDFGNKEIQEGFIGVSAETIYDSVRGFGFVSNSLLINESRENSDPLFMDFCTSEQPFYFVINLPEGNYELVLHIGDSKKSSLTTIKAESRRLFREGIETSAGDYISDTILVNVRTPRIDAKQRIRLKSREYPYLNWDDKLTIEFNNTRPLINGIEIKRIDEARQIFLAGNSTVVDQEYEPWCSWGQIIPNFLTPDVVVVNLAESGESLKSFKARGRLDKLLSMIQANDYVFIEFGHNDQKPQSSSYVEAFSGYKEELKDYISKIRAKGGNPVLVTPTQRRAFDSTGSIINTHGDYPAAMKEAAQEESVPFIDLNAMSKVLYESLGVEGSKKALVHYPANSFPGQEQELADNTHFNPYGAYQIAKCILQGVVDLELELVKYIDNFDGYDPAKPDLFEEFAVPASPSFLYAKPDGN